MNTGTGPNKGANNPNKGIKNPYKDTENAKRGQAYVRPQLVRKQACRRDEVDIEVDDALRGGFVRGLEFVPMESNL